MGEKLSVEEELGLDAEAVAIMRAMLFDKRYEAVREEGDRIYQELLRTLEKYVGSGTIGALMYAIAKSVATIAVSANKSSPNAPNPLVISRTICYIAEVFVMFGAFRPRKEER